MKQHGKKSRLDLVPPRGLLAVGAALAVGADEHGERTHLAVARGEGEAVYLGAALRHLYLHLGGHEIDPASGQLHLAHAAADVLIALEAVAKEVFPARGWAPEGEARRVGENVAVHRVKVPRDGSTVVVEGLAPGEQVAFEMAVETEPDRVFTARAFEPLRPPASEPDRELAKALSDALRPSWGDGTLRPRPPSPETQAAALRAAGDRVRELEQERDEAQALHGRLAKAEARVAQLEDQRMTAQTNPRPWERIVQLEGEIEQLTKALSEAVEGAAAEAQASPSSRTSA